MLEILISAENISPVTSGKLDQSGRPIDPRFWLARGKESLATSMVAARPPMEFMKRLLPELMASTSFNALLDARQFPMYLDKGGSERETVSQSLVGERGQARLEARLQGTMAEPWVREDDSVLGTFWESPTLEELACLQNVQPMTDVRVLFGTWPGDEDDGFEATIDELRHPAGSKNGERS